MKILFADDHAMIRESLSEQIRRLNPGAIIDQVGTLDEALDVFGPEIDLVLLDLQMPGMNGLELLPKAEALRPDVPVIMITAYGDAETKRKTLEGGADAFMTKPIDFAVLRSEIETRVERAV